MTSERMRMRHSPESRRDAQFDLIENANSAAPIAEATISNRMVGQILTGPVQRAATGNGALDEDVAHAIQARRGSGSPLPVGVREDMEAALSTDLSGVRMHTDRAAHELNQAVGARAFTTGSDVFFSYGAYSSTSASGRQLLGHELTHVVQQRTGAPDHRPGTVSHPSDPAEQQARAVGQSLVNKTTAAQHGTDLIAQHPATIHRADSDSSPAKNPVREPGELEEDLPALLHAHSHDPDLTDWVIAPFPIGFAFPLTSSGIEALLAPIRKRLDDDLDVRYNSATGDLVAKRRVLVIMGYTDCFGTPDLNAALRTSRAEAIAAFFPEDAVYAARGAKLGSYLASNHSRVGRGLNRAVKVWEMLVSSDRPEQDTQDVLEERAEAVEEAHKKLPEVIKEVRQSGWTDQFRGDQRATIEGLLTVLAGNGNDEFYTSASVRRMQLYADQSFSSSPVQIEQEPLISPDSARTQAALALAASGGDLDRFRDELVKLDHQISSGVNSVQTAYAGLGGGLFSPEITDLFKWVWNMSEREGSLMSYYVTRDELQLSPF